MGYPLFPSTALAAPVAWRVPKADVTNLDGIVQLGRRQPDPDLAQVQGGIAWIPDFLRRNWEMKDQFATPLSLGSVWALLLLAFAWKNVDFRRKLGYLLLMIWPWYSPWSCGFSLPPIPDTLVRSPGFSRSLPHWP